MKLRSSFPLFCATLLLLGSCKKDAEDNGGTPLPNPTPAQNTVWKDRFAQAVEAAAQHYTVDAATGGYIWGNQGTLLQFGPNAFRRADGSAVTGTVQVSLVEVLDLGTMIRLNKPTVGNDNGTLRLLRSGGEIRVRATQGGAVLKLAESGMDVSMPAMSADPAMELFTGDIDANGELTWDPSPDPVVLVQDSGFMAFNFNTDSLDWINCDYFYNYPNLTNITATLPDGQLQDSTYVWLVFPTDNAVMGMRAEEDGTYTNGYVGVPVGASAVVVGLYRNGNSHQSAFQNITITGGLSVPLTFQPTTPDQFALDLNGL